LWGHKNGFACDNGAAKRDYLNQKGSGKVGGGGRGSGARGGN
jgi:hypothetical protein